MFYEQPVVFGRYEPRPNTHDKRYILLPGSGYPFGVEAGPSLGNCSELHGGFETQSAAEAYAAWLRREYSDYEYVVVVKIETPNVGVEA